MKMVPVRVFVSHSRKDLRTKEIVQRGLRKAGLTGWYYEEVVDSRTATTAISARIKKAVGFFVFITEYSMNPFTRDWICFEMGLAKAHHKRIYCWKGKESAP